MIVNYYLKDKHKVIKETLIFDKDQKGNEFCAKRYEEYVGDVNKHAGLKKLINAEGPTPKGQRRNK